MSVKHNWGKSMNTNPFYQQRKILKPKKVKDTGRTNTKKRTDIQKRQHGKNIIKKEQEQKIICLTEDKAFKYGKNINHEGKKEISQDLVPNAVM